MPPSGREMASRVMAMEKSVAKLTEPEAYARKKLFRLDEVKQVVQEIVSRHDLGYTEVTYQRVGGEVKFVKFSAVFKIEEE